MRVSVAEPTCAEWMREVCMCAYACVYVCMYIYIYIYMKCIHKCMRVSVAQPMCCADWMRKVCVCVHMRMDVCEKCTYVCVICICSMHACKKEYITHQEHTHIYMYTCMHTYIHAQDAIRQSLAHRQGHITYTDIYAYIHKQDAIRQ